MTLDVLSSVEEGGLSESKKLVRYDRQLRLWEQHGQEKLEKARVCLLNASATGCEALKSLVLPGIGNFTIVDGDKVDPESAADNFFLDFNLSGEPKAKVSCERLMMLNPEVEGNYVAQDPEDLFSSDPHFFGSFSVVIGTNLSERFTHTIGEYLWVQQIPFVLCKSYGLIGYLRIVVREHCVYEARPENPFDDFMLDQMATPLLHLADSLNVDSMDHEAFKGLPYLILVVKALDHWRLSSGKPNAFPETSEDIAKLKVILNSMAKCQGSGTLEAISTNVTEALGALNKCVRRSEIPANVLDVLNDPCAHDPKGNRKPFWILAHALKSFVENEGDGRLPLRGSLPDMSSDTELYIRLQNIYKDKAQSDAQIVHNKVSKFVAQLGPSEDAPHITFEETKRFCRSAACLRVIKGRSLKQEFSKDSTRTALIENELKSENRLMAWYLLLRAAERFRAEKGRYPGTNGIPVDLDKNDLAVRFEAVLQTVCSFKVACADLLQELCRFGAAELHCVAAIVGGLAAQEVVKLITGQFTPINNTFIYDGHNGDEGTPEPCNSVRCLNCSLQFAVIATS
uniref:NEDD8-activating enzyme E1 regulatory subunit n=1 Tax=Trichuris muris TaxID=70415 RepID=A0A5S6Q0R0_TRIMR